MKKHFYTTVCKLYFSRWCKKGYALFAAIGREVCISNLTISMCKSVLLKSAGKGIIVSDVNCFLYQVLDKACLYEGFYIVAGLMGKVYPDEFRIIKN